MSEGLHENSLSHIHRREIIPSDDKLDICMGQSTRITQDDVCVLLKGIVHFQGDTISTLLDSGNFKTSSPQ